jgi:hypothetical protein
VRTTIRIDGDLYREVKERAVLEDAVRRGLNLSEERAEGRYRVRPSGGGGLRPGVDLGSNAAVAEIVDEGASLDALR